MGTQLATAGRGFRLFRFPRHSQGKAEFRSVPHSSDCGSWSRFILGVAINHISMAVRIRGSVNPDVLKRSVREIVRRHEILRTGSDRRRVKASRKYPLKADVALAEHDFQR